MNITKEIFRLAIPNIISNVTVPLMGLVSTAIAGRIGDSALSIGSLAIGVSIFNFLYWNTSFIRMGTSGLTAQAFGRGDFHETTLLFLRSMLVCVIVGVVVLLLQYPFGKIAVRVMNGNEIVSSYFFTRIWAVPAGIALYGIYGWLIGMQNAVLPMTISIFVNLVHVLFSFLFAFGMDMGIRGIALASVVAQWSGLLLSLVLIFLFYHRKFKRVTLSEVVDSKSIRLFFRINTDIIIRTFCLCLVYTFFTAASARMEDKNALAMNTMLLQLFTLFSYMNDGFAYASEALVGRFVGARDLSTLRLCIKHCFVWSFATAFIAILLYVVYGNELMQLFVSEGEQSNALVLQAMDYIWWIVAIPLISAIPFLLDGIMTGATLTKIMRDSMLLSTTLFFVIFYLFKDELGNNAIWLGFASYMVIRGVCQLWMSHGLKSVFDKAR
ncbi:MAG: MATE family efflux transporter [Alistipes sp.]|nr:MATE family efflux transporter [Candidatus Alistipes equi]